MTLDQLLKLGMEKHDAGDLKSAEKIYRQILAADPNCPHALHLMGRIAMQVGQTDLATKLIHQAIHRRPEYIEARYSLALSQRLGNRIADAIATLRDLLTISPDHFDARRSLGELLQEQGDIKAAIEQYSLAIALRPGVAELHNNLAGAHQELGHLQLAIDSFRQALTLAPESAAIHYNFGLALLLNGDLQEGFAEHEWRWQVDRIGLTKRQFSQPRWDGSDLSGRTILIYCEQGFGDSIQFIRYLPLLLRQGVKVILQLPQELVRLAQHSSDGGSLAIVPFGELLPRFDVHLPMMSLPSIMKTSLASIPATIPYLRAEQNLADAWAGRIRSLAGTKVKVGLVWAGRPEHWNDRNRTIPKSFLADLIRTHGVHFFSLTPLGEKMPGVTDIGSGISDFAETAALIQNLDLVISVDTAAAHLAGAMGKNTWLLLPFAPDWRWMRDRNDSPWYPTMKLFREPVRGDWSDVLRQVQGAIERLIEESIAPMSRDINY